MDLIQYLVVQLLCRLCLSILGFSYYFISDAGLKKLVLNEGIYNNCENNAPVVALQTIPRNLFISELYRKEFSSCQKLKVHKYQKHSKNVLPCKICGKMSQDKTHLKKHLVSHSSVLPFKSIYCNLSYSIGQKNLSLNSEGELRYLNKILYQYQ